MSAPLAAARPMAAVRVASSCSMYGMRQPAHRRSIAVRRVRHQALDAANVAIVDGLHEGDRVVVEGAGLLSQVR